MIVPLGLFEALESGVARMSSKGEGEERRLQTLLAIPRAKQTHNANRRELQIVGDLVEAVGNLVEHFRHASDAI